MTSRAFFIGDEVAAAGWRLAGVETRVPTPGAEGEALAAAPADAALVLLGAATATRVPDKQLRAALRRVSPVTVIVPDLRAAAPYPDVAARMHDDGIGNYKQVDDRPFGGGSGMILMCEPVFACIERLKSERQYDEVIYLSPDGNPLRQSVCNELSLTRNLILLCGHYEGVDHRVVEALVDEEISIGDYVLTNGAIAAVVFTDAVIRLIPGVLGDARSPVEESFGEPGLLEAPHYTRPPAFEGMEVHVVLLSGHHGEIARWRKEQALERTRRNRPDLLPASPDERPVS